MKIKQLINIKKHFINATVISAIQDFQLQPIKLLPEQVIKEKAQIQAQDELNFFLKKIEQGYNFLLQAIKESKKEETVDIQLVINQIQQHLLEISQNIDEKIQTSLFIKEIQHHWGTTYEERSQLYLIAKEILEKKEFEKSSEIFFTLILLFPQIAEFWLGLGMAEKEQGHCEIASTMFMQAILLNPQLIEAYLSAIDCYLAQGDSVLALEVLNFLFENNPSVEIDPSWIKKIKIEETL
jgi:tetratricopeptide (TPR) repeat protein